jgi:AraC-like DNA-binding protein
VGAQIRAIRLHRAWHDLSDQRLHQQSIAEVASHNGFLNQSFFATSFKKEFGVSPRSVRASART